MPFLEFFDETLDINSTGNYHLSVQVCSDSIAYCLLDTIRNKYILLRSYDSGDNKYLTTDSISDIISKDDFLTRQYNKVSVVYPSPKFTIVPSPLFDPAKKEEYFSLNHIREENQVILSNKLADPDSFVIYAVQKQLYDGIMNFFPSVSPMHHTKPLLHQLAYEAKHNTGQYVQVHIENEYFNLFVFEEGNLKFSNSFSYRNISDILYYVLNTYKNLNISNEEPVNFSGMTEKHDDIYSAFAIYLRHIRFSVPSGSFTFSYVFNDLELHRYLNLFTAINCAS